jgi:hypothetical protein
VTCNIALVGRLAPTEARSCLATSLRLDGTLIQALPRAWRSQWLLEAGVYSSVTDLSEAEAISNSYVHGILGWPC